MQKKDYLECGRVQNTHGCHGWVRVESYCDSPEVLASLKCLYRRRGEGYEAVRVLETGRKQETVLMHLEGIEDMDAAELLKNETLYAARADIPLAEGAYFIVDLEGLPVLDADNGREYGRVSDVQSVGGQELISVKTPSGVRLLPNVPAFVVRVDVESGVYVRPIPGLLED
jgi:16S rRNA processing protein RimM